MEDYQDFGWQAAKGAHAVLLVKMEEGPVVDKVSKKSSRTFTDQSMSKALNR